MRCSCCEGTAKEGMSCCPFCGFPLLGNAGEMADAVLAGYRKKLLENIRIAVKFYYYAYNDDGELTEQHSEYVTVSDALSLTVGEISWFGGLFDAAEMTRDIPLEVRVRNGASERELVLTAPVGGSLRCGRLGVCLTAGLRLRFAVGDEQCYHFTEEIALLHES